ncbi:MAG: hypothetical protein DHS20C18_39070 [Saprospiraceae bacterium]|nr:MAG: hypothetical protein DHS20C18_39070 [Saprospiraceae bacterium]
MKNGWCRLLWGVIFGLCWGGASGQLPDFHIIQVNEVDNKPINNIYSIVEDEEGFLWMGGTYGLFRYDGTTFTTFYNDPANATSIPFGTIFKIVKSKSGGLWLASKSGGLGYFDLATEKAVRFEKNPEDLTSLSGEQVHGLYEDSNGDLWVGTNNFALHKLPKDSSSFEIFHPELPNSEANNYTLAGSLGEIIPDLQNPNLLWIGSNYGIYRFEKQNHTFQLFPFGDAIEIWYQPLNVQLHMDPSGKIWAGSWQTGLLSLDPKTGQWTVQKKQQPGVLPEVGSNTVEDIFAYNDHLILVLTLLDGLQWVDLRDGILQSGPSPRIAGTPYPLNLLGGLRAKNGALWIGGNSAFLRMATSGHPFPMLMFADVNPELNKRNWQRSYALSPSGNLLYIGTLRGNGLIIWDWKQNHLKAISYKKMVAEEDTDVLFDDLCFDQHRRLWIGTDEGLLFLDAGSRTIFPFLSGGHKLESNHISALCVYHNQLWAGTKGDGIYRIDLTTEKIIDHLLEKATINRILADKSGRVWIGAEEGLWCFDGMGDKFTYFGQQTETKAGLSRANVTDLALDEEHNLWIATRGGGLNRLLSADPEQAKFDLFLNEETPGGNIIFEIEMGLRSGIWLGTESGIGFFDPDEGVFVNYDYRDEMFPKIGSMITLPDGRIVSAAFRGFHLFDPDTLNGVAGPVAYLRNFRVFDQKIALDQPINHLSSISLSHWQNHFSLELGALNFTENARNTFAYQLEGYDEDWVYSGNRSYVSYTNLPTGYYRFKVKAANQHYRWSDQVKTLELIIHPPFWETGWFRTIILLVLGTIIYRLLQFYQKRKQVKERQKEQEQQLLALDRDLSEAQLIALRAQMNPHFLFNCLNSINWYIIKNKPREASRYLTKFSRLIRMILDHSKSHKIPLDQELVALRLYVEMEAMRFDNKFEFQLDVDPTLDTEEIEIAPLIFQPFVENAIWHGLMQSQKEESILKVSIFPEAGMLQCVIEDNGIGRNKAEKLRKTSLVMHESKGMKITTDRISMLNHNKTFRDQVFITDLYDEIGRPAGTRVHLKLPLS